MSCCGILYSLLIQFPSSMLQVASFALPGEQAKANSFFRQSGVKNTGFNKDMIFVVSMMTARSRKRKRTSLTSIQSTTRDGYQEVSAAIRTVEAAI